MTNSKAILLIVTAISILAPVPACAAPMEFDCDVPADRSSTVSQEMLASGSVSGLISVNQMRKGNYLPMVGAGIFNSDKHPIARFQLVAANADPKNFAIMFTVLHNGEVTKTNVGEIDASSVVTFDISLSTAWIAVLIINGRQYQADASVISSGKAMAFCSTAQFTFNNLVFSTNSVRSGS